MIVSIITVVKNDLVRLKQTISSLENFYNDNNFEHIIIDGISIDCTHHFINQLKQRNNNLFFKSSIDNGIYDAMNLGIKLSKGDFIIFINAGDKFVANKEKLIQKLEQFMFQDIQILCFPFQHEFLGQIINRYPTKKNRDKLPTSHQSMFFSKSFLKNNNYNLLYKIASDFDLYLKADWKKICLISNFLPISIVEYEGVASKNPNLSYSEYKSIVKKRFNGFSRISLLIKINLKLILVKVFKYVFLKKSVFKIRKLFDRFWF